MPTALGPGAGFVHLNGPAAQNSTIQCRDGPVRFGRVRHLDERKTTRLPRIPVANQTDPFDGPVLFEKRADGFLGNAEIQVANKNILHSILLYVESAFTRLNRVRPGSAGQFKRLLSLAGVEFSRMLENPADENSLGHGKCKSVQSHACRPANCSGRANPGAEESRRLES
jgi:hypothetical protein